MQDKTEIINLETVEEITEDIIKIFGSNNNDYLSKNECRNILNIIFEALFDEKLKTKNFNYIYKIISNDDEDKVHKKDFPTEI